MLLDSFTFSNIRLRLVVRLELREIRLSIPLRSTRTQHREKELPLLNLPPGTLALRSSLVSVLLIQCLTTLMEASIDRLNIPGNYRLLNATQRLSHTR